MNHRYVAVLAGMILAAFVLSGCKKSKVALLEEQLRQETEVQTRLAAEEADAANKRQDASKAELERKVQELPVPFQEKVKIEDALAANAGVLLGKSPHGNSPEAQAILDTQRDKRARTEAAIAEAEKRPEPEREAALEKALEEMQQAPAERAAAAEAAKGSAQQDAVKQLLADFGPLAAGAACLAFGGPPQVCGVVMQLVANLFGGSTNFTPEQRMAMLTDMQQIASGTCDASCVREKLGKYGITEEKIEQGLKKVAEKQGVPPALREAARHLEVVRVAKPCLEAVGNPAQLPGNTVAVQHSTWRQIVAAKPQCEALRKVIGVTENDARCVQGSLERTVTCILNNHGSGQAQEIP